MKEEAIAGLYRMNIAQHVYYGETDNLIRRRAQHWKELVSKRHHNILLRRLVCEYGLEAVTFTVIAAGPEWKDSATRKAEELRLMTGDENSLNTAGQVSVYATNLRLPDKDKYRSRELYLRFSRGVVTIYTQRNGPLIGIERARGKIATGHYVTDERNFINASIQKRSGSKPSRARANNLGLSRPG